MSTLKLTTLIALLALLASCASSGLYNMSDDWCATHLSATAARCPFPDAERVVDGERGRVANNVVEPKDQR